MGRKKNKKNSEHKKRKVTVHIDEITVSHQELTPKSQADVEAVKRANVRIGCLESLLRWPEPGVSVIDWLRVEGFLAQVRESVSQGHLDADDGRWRYIQARYAIARQLENFDRAIAQATAPSAADTEEASAQCTAVVPVENIVPEAFNAAMRALSKTGYSAAGDLAAYRFKLFVGLLKLTRAVGDHTDVTQKMVSVGESPFPDLHCDYFALYLNARNQLQIMPNYRDEATTANDFLRLLENAMGALEQALATANLTLAQSAEVLDGPSEQSSLIRFIAALKEKQNLQHALAKLVQQQIVWVVPYVSSCMMDVMGTLSVSENSQIIMEKDWQAFTHQLYDLILRYLPKQTVAVGELSYKISDAAAADDSSVIAERVAHLSDFVHSLFHVEVPDIASLSEHVAARVSRAETCVERLNGIYGEFDMPATAGEVDETKITQAFTNVRSAQVAASLSDPCCSLASQHEIVTCVVTVMLHLLSQAHSLDPTLLLPYHGEVNMYLDTYLQGLSSESQQSIARAIQSYLKTLQTAFEGKAPGDEDVGYDPAMVIFADKLTQCVDGIGLIDDNDCWRVSAKLQDHWHSAMSQAMENYEVAHNLRLIQEEDIVKADSEGDLTAALKAYKETANSAMVNLRYLAASVLALQAVLLRYAEADNFGLRFYQDIKEKLLSALPDSHDEWYTEQLDISSDMETFANYIHLREVGLVTPSGNSVEAVESLSELVKEHQCYRNSDDTDMAGYQSLYARLQRICSYWPVVEFTENRMSMLVATMLLFAKDYHGALCASLVKQPSTQTLEALETLTEQIFKLLSKEVGWLKHRTQGGFDTLCELSSDRIALQAVLLNAANEDEMYRLGLWQGQRTISELLSLLVTWDTPDAAQVTRFLTLVKDYEKEVAVAANKSFARLHGIISQKINQLEASAQKQGAAFPIRKRVDLVSSRDRLLLLLAVFKVIAGGVYNIRHYITAHYLDKHRLGDNKTLVKIIKRAASQPIHYFSVLQMAYDASSETIDAKLAEIESQCADYKTQTEVALEAMSPLKAQKAAPEAASEGAREAEGESHGSSESSPDVSILSDESDNPVTEETEPMPGSHAAAEPDDIVPSFADMAACSVSAVSEPPPAPPCTPVGYLFCLPPSVYLHEHQLHHQVTLYLEQLAAQGNYSGWMDIWRLTLYQLQVRLLQAKNPSFFYNELLSLLEQMQGHFPAEPLHMLTCRKLQLQITFVASQCFDGVAGTDFYHQALSHLVEIGCMLDALAGGEVSEAAYDIPDPQTGEPVMFDGDIVVIAETFDKVTEAQLAVEYRDYYAWQRMLGVAPTAAAPQPM